MNESQTAHAFSEREVQDHANRLADFLWVASGKTGHNDVWREWVRNEFQKLMEAVEIKLSERRAA